MNRISPNLNIMIKAAEKASKVLIRDFGELENLQVTQKGPKDFVTNSDKKVEKILIEELEKYKKNYSFLSEENGKIEKLERTKILLRRDARPNGDVWPKETYGQKVSCLGSMLESFNFPCFGSCAGVMLN